MALERRRKGYPKIGFNKRAADMTPYFGVKIAFLAATAAFQNEVADD
jgi:hypothetical protein